MWQSATIPPRSVQKPGCSTPSCSFSSEWQEDLWLKEQTPVDIPGFCAGVKHRVALQDTQSPSLGTGSGFHCPTKYIHTTDECFNLFLATSSNLLEPIHILQYSFWPNFHLCFQHKARQCRAVSSQAGELLSSILKLHSKAGWPWDVYLALPLLLAKKRKNSWSFLSRQHIQVL